MVQMLLARTIMQKFARIGILCEHRENGLKELSRLCRMLAEAFQGTLDHVSARDYVSSLAKVRDIRLHIAAVRESLVQHRAEHGC